MLIFKVIILLVISSMVMAEQERDFYKILDIAKSANEK